MSRANDHLVLLAVAESEVEATIWRDALEQEGVRVFVKTADPLAPIGVPALLAALEVYVNAADEQRARWILGDRHEPARGEADAVAEDTREQTASRD